MKNKKGNVRRLVWIGAVWVGLLCGIWWTPVWAVKWVAGSMLLLIAGVTVVCLGCWQRQNAQTTADLRIYMEQLSAMRALSRALSATLKGMTLGEFNMPTCTAHERAAQSKELDALRQTCMQTTSFLEGMLSQVNKSCTRATNDAGHLNTTVRALYRRAVVQVVNATRLCSLLTQQTANTCAERTRQAHTRACALCEALAKEYSAFSLWQTQTEQAVTACRLLQTHAGEIGRLAAGIQAVAQKATITAVSGGFEVVALEMRRLSTACSQAAYSAAQEAETTGNAIRESQRSAAQMYENVQANTQTAQSLQADTAHIQIHVGVYATQAEQARANARQWVTGGRELADTIREQVSDSLRLHVQMRALGDLARRLFPGEKPTNEGAVPGTSITYTLDDEAAG